MPNWCYNTLTIEGSTEKLEAFRVFAVGDETVHNHETGQPEQLQFCFKRFIPLPTLTMDDDWDELDWCQEHWDTKWEPDSVEVIATPLALTYTFQTAWAPPMSVIFAAAERFPMLKFMLDYEEPGIGFKGIYERIGDDVLQNSHWTWNWMSDEELQERYAMPLCK